MISFMLKENQPIDEKDTNKPKTKKKTKFRIWKLFLLRQVQRAAS